MWKTIDTAPRDGTPVELGWLPNGELEHGPVRSRWRCDVGLWDGFYTPTHWRPAPEAARD